MTVTVPTKTQTTYGWSADGKTAAEISSDIRQTRYRLDSDVQALRAKLAPTRLIPVAAITGGLAALSLLIRLIKRRRR
jgi:hypothetical protein